MSFFWGGCKVMVGFDVKKKPDLAFVLNPVFLLAVYSSVRVFTL